MSHTDNEGYQEDVKVIILRRFGHLASANIAAARLREAGVPCFISNANARSLLPFVEDGFVLHVNADDAQRAEHIIRQLEAYWATPQNGDHPDDEELSLEHEGIEPVIINRQPGINKTSILLIILAILILILGVFSAYFGTFSL